jgi:tetratricopeptide (TPR) repeat protein
MDNSTPDILVQYLDGELSGTDKLNLEHQLSGDAGMREQLNSLHSAREAIRLYGLKQKISGMHVEMMEELWPAVIRMQPANRSKKIIRYSIAAAAMLLLLISGYMIFSQAKPTPEKVFASNYSHYELVTLRDGNNTETKVEKAYRQKNYTEVLRIHDANEDHTPKGEFLCGAAALETKNLPKAIKCFNEVLDASRQTGQPVLKDEAEYYLSLSYIRNKNYDEALTLLNAIEKDPAHTYNDKVDSKLIRQVERLNKK